MCGCLQFMHIRYARFSMCTLYTICIAAYLYVRMYLSLRYTIVNSENYRNYSKCQFKRRNTTFPPFHASNRFWRQNEFCSFRRVYTTRVETRRCGIANCGLLFFWGLLFAASFLAATAWPKNARSVADCIRCAQTQTWTDPSWTDSSRSECGAANGAGGEREGRGRRAGVVIARLALLHLRRTKRH